MSLQYTAFLDIDVKNITTLDFSTLGSKLAAVTSAGFLKVWNLETGKEYYPSPGPVASTNSCIRWKDDSSFVCGSEDGYVLVGRLHRDSTLSIRRTKWAGHSLSILSVNKDTGLLAAGNTHRVKFWKNDLNDWIFLKDLPNPPMGNINSDSDITSFEWISQNTLLVAYLDHGILIWDVDSLEVIHSVKPKNGRQILSGAYCCDVQKFAALNDLGRLDIYDIQSGKIWSPSLPEDIYLVKAVHRGSSILAAGVGHPELVDIENTRVSEIFPRGTPSAPKTTSIATYQDDNEQIFMIATAYTERIVVFRTEVREEARDT